MPRDAAPLRLHGYTGPCSFLVVALSQGRTIEFDILPPEKIGPDTQLQIIETDDLLTLHIVQPDGRERKIHKLTLLSSSPSDQP